MSDLDLLLVLIVCLLWLTYAVLMIRWYRKRLKEAKPK
jgi:hypothetical protein